MAPVHTGNGNVGGPLPPSKDTIEIKDEKKEEDLSEEDLALKHQSEPYVERLQKTAPESMSHSLRLATLLVEMKEGLDLVRSKVQLLVQKVKENYYCTKDGISYLDVKYLLLLSYCQSIVYYLLRKAEGSSIQGHPVTNYLIEIRLFLEKIRPIDKKHQYLIEKLSRVDANVSVQGTASKNEGNFNVYQEDALKYRPNPDMLVSKLDPVAQDGEGVYRPPMFAPTIMDEEKNSRDKKLQMRKQKEMLHKASRSAFVKELANNLEGKPEEVREIVGAESKEMLREQSKLVERARQEEELFTRVPLSRIEKKKIKHLKRSRNGLLGLMDDFNDDISGLIAMEKNDGSDVASNHSRRQGEGRKKFKKRKVALTTWIITRSGLLITKNMIGDKVSLVTTT